MLAVSLASAVPLIGWPLDSKWNLVLGCILALVVFGSLLVFPLLLLLSQEQGYSRFDLG